MNSFIKVPRVNLSILVYSFNTAERLSLRLVILIYVLVNVFLPDGPIKSFLFSYYCRLVILHAVLNLGVISEDYYKLNITQNSNFNVK